MKYFQVKVQFTNEEDKKQNVTYLVNAVSVTEAEIKIIKYLNNEGEQTLEVKAVSESKIAHVILDSEPK